MRILVVCCFLFSAAACSKHNPAVCCNTPTQCSSFGLDGVIGCDTGKVCDSSGACVSPQCASSAECADPMAYCSSDGLCVATCVADSECPGGGQGSDQIHCSNGACVQCATAADCSGTSPICSTAQTCVACKLDADCPSQACNTDGSCVDPSMIAYVSTTGTDTADCSQATPCSLTHGIGLGRAYTIIASGTYQTTATLVVTGAREVIGVDNPTISRTTPGPIITVGLASDLHLFNVTISGATNTNTTSFDGVGIECPNDQTPRSLELEAVTVTNNAANGVDANTCAVSATRSSFNSNGGQVTRQGSGLYVKDYAATIDRCSFVRNTNDGFTYDGTVAIVTNSFFVGNAQSGANINTGSVGGSIQFCTIVDNLTSLTIEQAPAGTSFDLSNNLVADNRNALVCSNANCPLTGSITLGSDVSTAHFKSATDYHITSGSVAIDAATSSTLDHDFDGDVRPLGNGRDVGADEAQ